MDTSALNFLLFLVALVLLGTTAQSQNDSTAPADSTRRSNYFSFDSLGIYGEASGMRDTIYSERDMNAGRIYLGGNGGFWGVSSKVALFVSTELTDVRQDMNLYSVENSYKWVSVSLGDHYPNYGQLSLAGIRTRGVGVALTPGNFRVEANVGQTHRGVEGDSLANRSGTYSRWLYGARLGYDNSDDVKISVNVVKMVDDVLSLANPYGTMPQENLLGGIDVHARFDHGFTYKAELVGSAHTRDVESATIRPEGVPEWISGFITPHSSTSVQYSMRHELKLMLTDASISALYSRVNSEYSSLGSGQLLSDWQEIKLDSRVSLLRRKLQISGFFSHRNNNLNDDRFLTTRQVSGGGTMNLYAWRGVYLNAMYSAMLESNDALDIIDMKRLLSHAFFIQPSFELYGADVIHHLDITTSIQTTKDIIGAQFPSLDFSSFTAGGNYFASFTGLFTFLAGYTLVLNSGVLDASTRHLLSGRLIWDLLANRLSTSLNATYTIAEAELAGTEDNRRLDFVLMARYSFSPSEHVQLDLRQTEYMDYFAADFSEFIGSIKYIRGI